MDPKDGVLIEDKPVWDAEEFKVVARYRKARKIAAVLLAHGADNADVVDTLPLRELAWRAAGVNEPSNVTWALVKELLREAL